MTFERLVEESRPKVYAHAMHLCKNRQDAEDLTQEAFYRAFRAFDTYEGDKPFLNWVLRIVSRLFLDFMRNSNRRIQSVSYDHPIPGEAYNLDVPDSLNDPEAALIEKAGVERIKGAVAMLPAQGREIAMLEYFGDLTQNEISAAINVPVGTVRSRLHRARRRLKAALS